LKKAPETLSVSQKFSVFDFLLAVFASTNLQPLVIAEAKTHLPTKPVGRW
jgi:hypothetical protein